uniref:Uncharacterized protein n=1 Tax=Anopheles christyi TaxID=43041 RepID=A0A182KET3_9DIPT
MVSAPSTPEPMKRAPEPKGIAICTMATCSYRLPRTASFGAFTEMLLSYNIRDRLSSIYEPKIVDEEIADRDRESKENGKLYADKRRNAKINSTAEEDELLLKKPFKSKKCLPTLVPKYT